MNVDKLIAELEVHCLAAVPVGSRVTVSPPPMDTDCDILCRCEDYDSWENFAAYLCDRDWDEEGAYGHMEFSSWRKEVEGTNTNLILTYSESFFDKFLEATVQCKKLNLQTKEERIALFDKVMGKKSKKKNNWAGPGVFAPDFDLKQLKQLEQNYNQMLAIQKLKAAQSQMLANHAALQAQVAGQQYPLGNPYANPVGGLFGDFSAPSVPEEF